MVIKKKILLFCPIGYLIEESFIPLIESLFCDYEISLLLGSEFLNKRQLKKLNTLCSYKKLCYLLKKTNVFYIKNIDKYVY